jgi:decaprenylphospho-beta-D-erythro-pentofuranosid-2-ulose 2-reductase
LRVHGRRVLLIGGTSEIGLAIVRQLARRGTLEVLLLGREATALDRAADQLRRAGCTQVDTLDGLDAAQPESHERLLERAFAELGGVDIAVLATGVLGAQREGLPEDLPAALALLQVNFTGSASLLMGVAARLRSQRGGILMVLSSAAAERPRRTNALYGASKAGLDSLAAALSDALRGDGVDVMVVRPGFVRTRMTRGLPQPPLACGPQDVARAAVAGMERRAQTVWAPPAMRWAMLALRLLPRSIFRKLSL